MGGVCVLARKRPRQAPLRVYWTTRNTSAACGDSAFPSAVKLSVASPVVLRSLAIVAGTGAVACPAALYKVIAMFPSAAPWVLFNIWAGYESDGSHNTVANIKSVYASSSLTTRDQIPNLK